MTKNHLPVQITNKKLLIGLLVFALLSTGLSLIFYSLTPNRNAGLSPSEFMSTNFNQTKSEFKKLTYNGPELDLPEKLPIAGIKLNPTIVSQIAQQMIEQYQLVQHPRSENIWVRDNYSLFHDKNRNEYIFNNQLSIQEQASESAAMAESKRFVGKTIQTEVAVNTATQFIQTLLPQSPYIPVKGQLKFLRKDKTDLDETIEKNATIIEIPFAPQVANLPVINNYDEYAPIRVMLNADNEIVKLTIQQQIIETNIVKQVATITAQQAVANILAGQGSIIAAYQNSINQLDLATITSGKLTKATSEYRTDIETGSAFPVYRFSGTVITNNGGEVSVEIITPAVVVTGPQQ